jgi:DNA-binding YbaB/EbfC family protein
MKGGFSDLMQQARQMQEAMAEAQERLAETEVTGEAGAGLVQVVMNGRHDVRRVTVDPGVLNEDKGMLEDLLAAAVNDAVRKVEALVADMGRDQLGGLASQLGMGDDFKMPF